MQQQPGCLGSVLAIAPGFHSHIHLHVTPETHTWEAASTCLGMECPRTKVTQAPNNFHLCGWLPKWLLCISNYQISISSYCWDQSCWHLCSLKVWGCKKKTQEKKTNNKKSKITSRLRTGSERQNLFFRLRAWEQNSIINAPSLFVIIIMLMTVALFVTSCRSDKAKHSGCSLELYVQQKILMSSSKDSWQVDAVAYRSDLKWSAANSL